MGGTTWSLDIALRAADGSVIVAECRRWQGPVKQEHVAAFAYKVELLRKLLGTKIAGVFFVRKRAQIGAVRAATGAGIRLAVCEQAQPLDAFSLAFNSCDPGRKAQLREGQVYAAGETTPTGSLTLQVIRRDS